MGGSSAWSGCSRTARSIWGRTRRSRRRTADRRGRTSQRCTRCSRSARCRAPSARPASIVRPSSLGRGSTTTRKLTPWCSDQPAADPAAGVGVVGPSAEVRGVRRRASADAEEGGAEGTVQRAVAEYAQGRACGGRELDRVRGYEAEAGRVSCVASVGGSTSIPSMDVASHRNVMTA